MATQALRRAALAAALVAAAPVSAQQVDDAAPLPPVGAAATFVPPAHDDDGYRTPNKALTPGETVWHVRVALNVAALGCRGPEEAATAAAYNAMLRANQATLAAAASASEAVFQARHGAAWQARYDDDMTRLYNFFAQPPAHDGFCQTAEAVLRESAAVAPADFPAFATAAMPRLEAPFLAFFAAYDAYRTSLAAWKTRHATVVFAAASVPPVATGVAAAPAPMAVAAAAPAEPVMIASVSPTHFGPQP
jgi:hypothetical protein